MITEKTKKMLHWTPLVLGSIIMFAALICEIISDCSDVLPDSDMYRAFIFLGLPIAWLSTIFEPISSNQLENGPGCFIIYNLIFLVFLPITWLSQIEHFTAPVVTILAISAILAIIDIVLAYKKSRRLKAMIEEKEKKQG